MRPRATPPEPGPIRVGPEETDRGGEGRLRVEVEIARAGRSSWHTVEVPPGTLVRAVLRELRLAPEGSAVMIGGASVPLDTPIETPLKIVVVPTFSGG